MQLARDPTFFWCDDFQAQYSAFFEEIVRSWKDGEWPLLSMNSWCAGNLAGEFQMQTFSPVFNILLLATDSLPVTLPLKAAILSTTHLIWLATGVFVLGRRRGLSISLATMAALATALSGWNITWAATDWIAFLCGFSWLPWVWWSLEVAIESDRVWKRWLRPGLFFALLITTGHAFGIAMVGVLFLWLTARSIIRDRHWHVLGSIFVAGMLGIGLSAPAWALLIDSATTSTRWGWWSVIHHGWVVPWRAWAGLVLPSFVTPWPDFLGNPVPHASLELACGLVPIAVLVAALFAQPRAMFRALRWELALLFVCVILVSLPSVGQFRWSFRWLPLFHLVLALSAATALHKGFAERAAFFSVLLIAASWAGAEFFAENRSPALAASLLCLSVVWWLASRVGPRSWDEWMPATVVTLALGATFACLPTTQSVPKYSFTDKMLDPAPLDPGRLYLSLYSFDEIGRAKERVAPYGNILRPVDSMHYAGLRFVNGYSSFDGRDVKGLFRPHGNVVPEVAESLSGPEGESLLLFLGVDGIAFSSEYRHFAGRLGPEWKKIAEAPEGVAYHRDPPRFTPVKVLKFLFDRPGVIIAEPKIWIVSEQRNRVTVDVQPASSTSSGVAPIAFVRPFLTGYQAAFNGHPVAVRAYRDILPLVELPADARGILELRYRPRGLIYGLLLTGASVLAMIAIAIFARKPSAQAAA